MNRLITHRIALLLLLLIPVLALGSCKKNRSIKPLSQLKREQRQAIHSEGARQRDATLDH